MISVAQLKANLEEMRNCGFWPSKVECGPLVFELLVNWIVFGQRFQAESEREEKNRLAKEERIRRELWLGLTDMTFNGMSVQLSYEVPDGRFWPIRERGGYINRMAGRKETDEDSYQSANA